MARHSTSWRDGRRIHIAGSFGGIVLVPVSVDRLIAIDHVLADVLERIAVRRDHDADDLRYLIFGQSVRITGGPPRIKLEVHVLQAMKRAMVEHIDLHQRDIFVGTDKALERDLGLEAQLLDQGVRELIEAPSGILVVHGVVSAAERAAMMGRAERRHLAFEAALMAAAAPYPGEAA